MKNNIKSVALVGVFAAVISVISQFALPLPSLGAPLTLQIFGVMLAGFCLPPFAAVVTMVTYTALGFAGAPVFSGFQGGAQVLFGPTGGFIWGFILLSLFCALARKVDNNLIKICLAALGIIICHTLGAAQNWVVTGTNFLQSFMLVSLPFILKDVVLGWAAYMISQKVKDRFKF